MGISHVRQGEDQNSKLLAKRNLNPFHKVKLAQQIEKNEANAWEQSCSLGWPRISVECAFSFV